MRILFVGSTKFSEKCLSCCCELKSIGVEVAGILSAPETFKISYAGSGGVLNYCYSDFLHDEKYTNIPRHIMTGKMSDEEVLRFCESVSPDFILVAGWYHMMPRRIREIAPLGTAGLHASLLPLYRGGAPLVWAMINGEMETGVSFFYLEDGVDSGDLIAQEKVDILYDDDIASLYSKIEDVSLGILTKTLPLIAQGVALRKKQAELPSTHKEQWPNRSPKDGLIDWNQPAKRIYDFIRAQTRPYPGAYTYDRETGKRITIWESEIIDLENSHEVLPGECIRLSNNVCVFMTAQKNRAVLCKEIAVTAR